jgi:hypothetical protein
MPAGKSPCEEHTGRSCPEGLAPLRKKEKTIMKMVRMALAAALIGGFSLSALSMQAAASPYHQDRLPNGTLTGPIAPDANGG